MRTKRAREDYPEYFYAYAASVAIEIAQLAKSGSRVEQVVAILDAKQTLDEGLCRWLGLEPCPRTASTLSEPAALLTAARARGHSHELVALTYWTNLMELEAQVKRVALVPEEITWIPRAEGGPTNEALAPQLQPAQLDGLRKLRDEANRVADFVWTRLATEPTGAFFSRSGLAYAVLTALEFEAVRSTRQFGSLRRGIGQHPKEWPIELQEKFTIRTIDSLLKDERTQFNGLVLWLYMRQESLHLQSRWSPERFDARACEVLTR
jgi:hypothetical protein